MTTPDRHTDADVTQQLDRQPAPDQPDGSGGPTGLRAPAGRRRTVAIGGGALLVVVVAVAAFLVVGLGSGDGARLAAHHGSESPSPASSGSPDVKSHKLSASPQASKRPQATEPPPLQPPSGIGDKVDWTPFAQAYGTATAAASASSAASNGVTQLRASQSFGDYNLSGAVSVTANAQYYASASQARSQYDSTCGGGGTKSGSLQAGSIGDRSCSYVSDVSDGSSGTAILYVQVLRDNVILQVAPMAFHNGAWSAADLGKLRATSVQCAGSTVAKL